MSFSIVLNVKSCLLKYESDNFKFQIKWSKFSTIWSSLASLLKKILRALNGPKFINTRSHKCPGFFEKKWSFAIYTKMSIIIKFRLKAQLSSISDFWLTVKNFRTFSHRFWFDKIKVWNFFEVQNCISRKSHVLLLDTAVPVFDLCSFWTRLWILTNFVINTLRLFYWF